MTGTSVQPTEQENLRLPCHLVSESRPGSVAKSLVANDTHTGPLIVIAVVLIAFLIYGALAWRLSAQRSADLQFVTENMRDGIVIQAVDGTILWCNQAFCEMTGYDRSECIGRSPLEFLVLEEERLTQAEAIKFRFHPDDKIFNQFETRENVRKDGSRYHVQIGHALVEPSHLDRKYGRRVVTTCRDVTESVRRDKALVNAQFDMISMIQTDPLTGLFSRAYIQNWLQHRLAESPTAPFVALTIDIINCRQISETLGHSASDAIISHVGQTIRLTVPDYALVARSGDGAFLLVLPGSLSLRETLRLWGKVEAALSEPARVGGGLKSIGVSVGIASHPGHSTSETAFMQNMQAARAAGLRRRGRNLGYYSDEVHFQATRQTMLRQDLPAALSSEEIHFEAQPVFLLLDRQMSGFELLIRWTHPSLGRVPPIDFLPIAAELGLMGKIDRLAAQRACKLQREFAQVGLQTMRIGFNLSSDAMENAEFSNWLEWHCDAHDVDPSRLCIEILETTFFKSDPQSDETAHQIERMRRAGFNLYLDDFGIGYAGLAHLAGLSISGLKIDRSLIDGIASRPASQIIVESILKLAQDLGLEVIAEGIETEYQLQLLRQMGCSKVQGYGIARPMPSVAAVEWAQSWQRSNRRLPGQLPPAVSAG